MILYMFIKTIHIIIFFLTIFRFRISAMIVYVGEENVNITGHYIAYCKRVKGCWEIHNDLAKEITRVNQIPQCINIQKILYIHSN